MRPINNVLTSSLLYLLISTLIHLYCFLCPLRVSDMLSFFFDPYGTVKIYNYYSFEWYYEPMKKKSKRFKTKEQAETFRDTIYPPHK